MKYGVATVLEVLCECVRTCTQHGTIAERVGSGSMYEPQSKLLASPLLSPIIVPNIILYITPFKEFRLAHIIHYSGTCFPSTTFTLQTTVRSLTGLGGGLRCRLTCPRRCQNKGTVMGTPNVDPQEYRLFPKLWASFGHRLYYGT